MKTLCLIPARSGSKRIKNKNIKLFHGKPIISYSINLAKKTNLFDDIYVSTDSYKIAKISKKYGAKIPFLRPKNISGDNTPDIKVKNHFINYCKKKNIKFDFICYLYPCSPLLDLKALKKSFKIIKKTNCEKLFSITKYPSNIERALKKNNKNEIFFKNKKYKYKRSQDLDNYYFDAGQFYWFNFKKKLKKKTLGFELKYLETIDINSKEDFKLALKLYKLKK